MEFAWIVYALLSAFSVASQNASLKRVFAAHNEYLVTWLSYGVTVERVFCGPSTPLRGSEAQSI